jgi:hypothetical protein
MRKIAFVIPLLLSFINAQHCPYDGCVVLKVHTREKSE